MRSFKKFSFRAHSQENARALVQVEESKWNEFFHDPSAWWDNRKIKSDPKEPDFIHAKSKDSLWIASFFSPPWLGRELKLIKPPAWDATKSLRAGYRSHDDPEHCDDAADADNDDGDEKTKSKSPDDVDFDPWRIRQHRNSLKGCTNLDQVRSIHLELARSKEAKHVEVAKTLIAVYSKLGGMIEARDVFERLAEPTQGSWNAMVRGFSDIGEKELSLEYFHRMIKAGMLPDARIFVRAFKACGDLAAKESGTPINGKPVKESSLKKATSLHRLAEKCGQESNIFVANAVLDLYSKCGGMEIARKVFERMAFQDPVSWNSMIMGYVHNDCGDVALELFDRMQEEEFVPNPRTFLAAITACSGLAEKARSSTPSPMLPRELESILDRGRKIHEQVEKMMFQGDVYIANALIDMYAKCGSMGDARRVFDCIRRRTIVSWNSILTGYSQNGEGNEAIELFVGKMREDGLDPSARTFVAVLGACSSMAAREEEKRQAILAQGRIFHDEIRRRDLAGNVFVANSLIEMYAKCGSMEEARAAFDSCARRDVAVWNTMIAACSQLGDPRAALDLFDELEKLEQANPRSYAAALAACSSASDHDEREKRGFLERGRGIHSRLIGRGLERGAMIASCLAEMYAKHGEMSEARVIFDAMESGQRDSLLWRWMIVGYSKVGNPAAAVELFRKMKEENLAPDAETLAAVLSEDIWDLT